MTAKSNERSEGLVSDLWTPQQLADRWKLSTATLANWRVAGRGPGFVKTGPGIRGRVMYPVHLVIKWENGLQSVDPEGTRKASARNAKSR